MYSEIEALNLSLANTRREAVAKAAQDFQTNFSKRSEADDAALAKLEEVSRNAAANPGEREVKLPFEGREEAVKRVWDGAREDIVRLGGKDGLANLKERAEGAESVVGWMEGR